MRSRLHTWISPLSNKSPSTKIRMPSFKFHTFFLVNVPLSLTDSVYFSMTQAAVIRMAHTRVCQAGCASFGTVTITQ